MADFRDVALDMGRESLGPDDLCRLANLLERPTKDGARRTREGMRECADAWEADIQKGANIATELARQLRTAEARIEALENWGEDAEGALIYASTILGSYAKDGNPAELAEGECDRVFAHWVTRRTGGDIMSSRGNLEWYDKNVKTPRVLELEARVDALEKLRIKVRACGVSSDIRGLDYIEVQIPRRLWAALAADEKK